ncbi:unnamed protein product [Cylicocyclus nassatus]|uniref:Uncharacterized protein n=1 Tax=Cylicocyclus nassatus TaxID=53992 RepID=A0AA36MDA2_CYLNA|nr:unnamed protein product [Cylicocyclus nassatus]
MPMPVDSSSERPEGSLAAQLGRADDGTNGEPGIGISTRESEDDFWQELMEVRGRVSMANSQDTQADAQPGDTADSNGTSRRH